MAYRRFNGEDLKSSFDILRDAISSHSVASSAAMQRSLYALTGVEQAVVNAPNNRGWLRKRLIELRESLEALGPCPLMYDGCDVLHLCREIALELQQVKTQPLT